MPKELISGSVTFEKMKFDDLLTRLPQLIAQGKIFLGFTGGIEALSNVSELGEFRTFA